MITAPESDVRNQEEQQDFELIVSHQTAATAAGFIGATVGAPVGTLIGRSLAYPIADRVSHAVEERARAVAEDLSQQVLDATGLSNVPGASYLINANVTNFAHEVGQQAYDQTVRAGSVQGAAAGTFIAGLSTFAIAEAVNGLGWLYQRYVSPYFADRREQRLTELARQMEAETARSSSIDLNP